MKMLLSNWLFLAFSLLTLCGFGQSINPAYVEFEQSSAVGLTNIVSTGVLFSNIPLSKPTSLLNEKTNSVKLMVRMDLGTDYVVKDFTGASNVFTVTANLQYRIGSSTPVPFDLVIKQDNPEQIYAIDITNDVLNLGAAATGVKIEFRNLIQNSVANTPGFALNYIKNKLNITAKVERNYGVDVRLASSKLIANDIVINNPIIQSNTNRVKFEWSSANDYPNYEIQVLHLFNEDAKMVNGDYDIRTSIDWSKALRVETQSYTKSVELMMMEGRGYYVWRVRPIGNYYDGGIANSENYGNWTNALEGESIVLKGSDYKVPATNFPNAVSSNASVFFIEDAFREYNWIYSRVFTEGDKNGKGVRTSEGMVFADNLLNTRQTQAFNSENKTAIVSQSVLDYMGRPSLTTLPVPLDQQALDGYKVGFVKAKVGNSEVLYTAEHFDQNANLEDPNTISDGSTSAFQYYNGSDLDGVAGTEGYSFSRTIYKTDGTGRVEKASGIGKKHALGTIASGKGRITQVIYRTPSEDELLRVFGEEAPLAESVLSTITIDPNGVASISYTSKEGKTIATALMNSNVASMDNIINTKKFDINNTTSENVLHDSYFESSKRFSFIENKAVEIDYKMLNTNASCISCKYKVQFYLIDLKNQQSYVSDADGYSGSNTAPFTNVNSFFDVAAGSGSINLGANWKWVKSDNSGVGPFAITNSKNFTLPAGEYLLIKRAYTSSSAIDADLESGAAAIEDFMDVITDRLLLAKNQTTFETADKFLSEVSDIFGGVGSRTQIEQAIRSKITALNEDYPVLGNLPDGFSIKYVKGSGSGVPGKLEIINNSAPSSCAGCGSQSIAIPKPEVCLLCEAKRADDKFDGINTILKATENKDKLVIGGEAWEKIRVLVDRGTYPDPTVPIDPNAVYLDGFMTVLRNNSVYKEYLQLGIQKFYDRFAPGFTEQSLIYMLTNMLTSKYYTGHTKLDGGLYYAAKEDENGVLQFIKNVKGEFTTATGKVLPENLPDLAFNYDCKKLYECWLSAVGSIGSVNAGDQVNVMDSFDAESDKTSSEEFDDKSNQEDAEDKGFMDKMSGWIVSRKMRKFNDSDEGIVKPARVLAMVNLPNMLMNCVGYQFKEIIDEDMVVRPKDYEDKSYVNGNAMLNSNAQFSGNSVSSVYPTVFGANNAAVLGEYDKDGIFKADVIECSTCPGIKSAPQLYYPYMLKAHWMFKYFVYNSSEKFNGTTTTLEDNDRWLINQAQVEVKNCYNDPYANCGGKPCSGKKCNYYHQSWSAGQKLYFYQQISGGRKCPASCDNPADAVTMVSAEELSADELKAMGLRALKEAKESCDGRKYYFRSQIVSALQNACYTVVECKELNGPIYQISEASVDLMAEKATAECKNQIEVIKVQFESKSAPYYNSQFPWSVVEGCVYRDEALNCQTSNVMRFQIFPDCHQKVLDEVVAWNFSVNIPQVQFDFNNDKVINDKDCPNFKAQYWKTPANLSPAGQTCDTKVNVATGTVVTVSKEIKQ